MKILGLSIDRVAVVGRMRRFKTGKKISLGGSSVDETDSKVMRMLRCDETSYGGKLDFMKETIWQKIEGQPDYASLIYNFRYKIGGHAFCQVNTGKSKGNDFRLEWNPNKVERDEELFIAEMLEWVEDKEFTRIDIALDIEMDLSSGWEIRDYKSRKIGEYREGATRNLETRYCGTNNSDVQVVVYHKAKEQNRMSEPGTYDRRWWRIEERIRGSAARDWENHRWFEGVEIIQEREFEGVGDVKFPAGTTPNDKAAVIACIVCPELLGEFGKQKQAKVRKMIKQVKRRDSASFLIAELVEKKKRLELGELKKRLRKIVTQSVYHGKRLVKTMSEEKAREETRKFFERIKVIREEVEAGDWEGQATRDWLSDPDRPLYDRPYEEDAAEWEKYVGEEMGKRQAKEKAKTKGATAFQVDAEAAAKYFKDSGRVDWDSE